MSSKKTKKVKPLTKKSKSSVSKLKIRKPNRYNSFQRALSDYLKGNGIKSKYKFHEISAGIYKELDPKLPVRGFDQFIDVLYRKKFYSSYDTEVSKSLESIEFYDVASVFRNDVLMKDFSVNVSFNDKIGDEGVDVVLEGKPLDFLEDFSASGLKKYLRNNYNGSPPALFVLRHFDPEIGVLYYDIEVESSNVGSLHYVPIGGDSVVLDKPERTRRSDLEKTVNRTDVPVASVSMSQEEIDKREKIRAKRVSAELKLINQYRKLGYSNEEIKKKLDNM